MLDLLGSSNLGYALEHGMSNSNQSIARLQATVDRLTEVVEVLAGCKLSQINLKTLGKERIKLSLEEIDGAEDAEIVEEENGEHLLEDEPESEDATIELDTKAKSKIKPKPKAKTKAKPKPKVKAKSTNTYTTYKKGQSVSFVGEDGEVLYGVIKTVSKLRKLVTATVGKDVWEIGFADIL